MSATERPRVYRRPRGTPAPAAKDASLARRGLARLGGLAFLAAAILHGLVWGGHLDYDGSPYLKLPGKFAGLFGLAADDIRITGLVHQEPEHVLSAIGVAPGSSLIGFDAALARQLLENLDWVASAKVARLFPNQLEIVIAEREPFAIWRRAESYYVIDRTGAAMSSLRPGRMNDLPLVAGEGAQSAAADLFDRLARYPELRAKLRAAAFFGERRWTLYLDNGVAVALPERDIEPALALVARLDREHGLLSKGIAELDLRLNDRIAVAVARVKPEAERGKLRVSRRQ